MKIQEILVESQLQEGPILNKIGSAIGKGAGTLAKGVGSIAGGVAGLGSALAKGYKAGKSAVSMAGDDAADTPAGSETEPAGGGAATGSAPAAGASGGGAPAAKKKAPTSTFGKLSAAANSGEEQPSGAPAAPGAAAPAAPGAAAPAAPGAAAPNPKADTAYAQAQKAIASLPPEQKKEIVTMLQADPKVKAAMTAKPKAKATKPAAPADAGAGAMGAMAGQLAKGGAAEPNTMANTPVSKTNAAKPGNPNAVPPATTKAKATKPAAPGAGAMGAMAGQLAKGGAATTTGEKPAPKKRAPKKPAAPSQAEIDADRERIMGATSDSIIRTKPMMAESFSLFRKR